MNANYQRYYPKSHGGAVIHGERASALSRVDHTFPGSLIQNKKSN